MPLGPGLVGNEALSTVTGYPECEYWGSFTNPAVTYAQRLKIINAAKALVGNVEQIQYVSGLPGDVLLPKNWNGKLNEINRLRCDGLVEVCYEINGVQAWGELYDNENHWNITKYLEDHNDMEAFWSQCLFPATQCGRVVPIDATTAFRISPLVAPNIPLFAP
jgi:hypothetical protein